MRDYLIVGLGLSGAALAYRMEKAGKSFLVFDEGQEKASMVAGGIMNPVILKRFTLAWNAEVLMKLALPFYMDVQAFLGTEFLRPLPVYRKFASIEEQNEWFSAADRPLLAPYLDTKLVKEINSGVKGQFSFGQVLNTWRLDTRRYLEAYDQHLERKRIIKRERFDYDELQIGNSAVEYKGEKARNIIFCEGFGLRNNPFFNYLPLRGNKGEYIYIKAPDLQMEVAVKASIFIFPVGRDIYAVGATYDHVDKSPHPTESARKILIEKLNRLVQIDYEIIDQKAGIRPAISDRKPILGKHPVHANMYCCNGFGSRGILQAPFMSKALLNHIENGNDLPPETDLQRFTRKWFPTSSL